MTGETRTPAMLQAAQAETLSSEPLNYGVLARVLFATMDLVYGRTATFFKFRVLEVVARVPYQAWENVGYVAFTHAYSDPKLALSIHERVKLDRAEQDNEAWHLLILEEYIERRRLRGGVLKNRIIPQLLAFAYYHVSWLLYVIRPSLSYAMNRDFEDHAEREYMRFVAAHPELEAEPFESICRADYGDYANMADVLRSIGLDEREHKLSSERLIAKARFTREAAPSA